MSWTDTARWCASLTHTGRRNEGCGMCNKECPVFGKCENCRHGKKEGKTLICRIGDRRGRHSRCFSCRKADRCKKRERAK